MTHDYEAQIDGGMEAPATARAAASGFARGRLSREETDTLRLLVSELITNSVKHAGTTTPLRLRLALDELRLRAEVWDAGEAGEIAVRSRRGADGGFGLFLVEQLASRWGVRREDETCVWFEIDRGAGTEPALTFSGQAPQIVDAERGLGFLDAASALLASSSDYEATLAQVVQLAVPDLADWCTVDLLEDDGALRQVSSGHPDPEQEALLQELRRRYRAEKQGSEGVRHVIDTGRSELRRDIAGNAEIELRSGEKEVYGRLGPRSYMIVPLVARRRVIGALTLLSTRPGRHYDEPDLAFAQHLARRFALAVDNARLLKQAEDARELLDTLYATAAVGLAFLDPELRFRRINQALAAMNGVAAEKHIGRTPREVLSDTLGGALEDRYRAVLAGGEPLLEQETTGRTTASPDADCTWLWSVTPVRDGEGGVTGLSVVVVDITDRRASSWTRRWTTQRPWTTSPTSPSPRSPTGARWRCSTTTGRSSRSRWRTRTGPWRSSRGSSAAAGRSTWTLRPGRRTCCARCRPSVSTRFPRSCCARPSMTRSSSRSSSSSSFVRRSPRRCSRAGARSA